MNREMRSYDSGRLRVSSIRAGFFFYMCCLISLLLEVRPLESFVMAKFFFIIIGILGLGFLIGGSGFPLAPFLHTFAMIQGQLYPLIDGYSLA